MTDVGCTEVMMMSTAGCGVCDIGYVEVGMVSHCKTSVLAYTVATGWVFASPCLGYPQ
jgi:hypothetical protein